MGSLVLDASAIVAFLTEGPGQVDLREFREADLHVPAVCDTEFLSALGRHVRAGSFSSDIAQDILIDYVSLPLARHIHTRLIGRAFELRDNFSAADATYVALAEWLDADLVTIDGALRRATRAHTGVRCVP